MTDKTAGPLVGERKHAFMCGRRRGPEAICYQPSCICWCHGPQTRGRVHDEKCAAGMCFSPTCGCWCHESEIAQELLGFYNEGSQTVAVPVFKVDPSRVIQVPKDEPEREDRERFQSLNLGYTHFGTAEQMKELAERIRKMLSVEMQQEVVILNGPWDMDPEVIKVARDKLRKAKILKELGKCQHGCLSGMWPPTIHPDCPDHGLKNTTCTVCVSMDRDDSCPIHGPLKTAECICDLIGAFTGKNVRCPVHGKYGLKA